MGKANDDWRPVMRMAPDTTYRHRVRAQDLVDRITPRADVFGLAHFGVARIDAETWRLHIGGLVERTVALSLQDILAFPKVDVEAFIKCAGFPHDHTIATRNVSNAVWGGARLSDVLSSVGAHTDASFLWAYAPDHGSYERYASDCYVKDIPMVRALAGDVLLAYEMNGEPLSPEHGHPLRLFVPGYYGTNSVKWLCRLEVADRRATHLFTSELYNDPVAPASGEPSCERAPVWEVAPEALVTSPAAHAVLPRGPITVTGWSWGSTEIDHVEISVDGGESWRRVRAEPRHQMSWQMFAFQWSRDEPGEVTICARAVDRNGNAQPAKDARNAIHRVKVTIR